MKGKLHAQLVMHGGSAAATDSNTPLPVMFRMPPPLVGPASGPALYNCGGVSTISGVIRKPIALRPFTVTFTMPEVTTVQQDTAVWRTLMMSKHGTPATLILMLRGSLTFTSSPPKFWPTRRAQGYVLPFRMRSVYRRQAGRNGIQHVTMRAASSTHTHDGEAPTR